MRFCEFIYFIVTNHIRSKALAIFGLKCLNEFFHDKNVDQSVIKKLQVNRASGYETLAYTFLIDSAPLCEQ